MRIGHAHLKVRDAEASAAFYERVLGLTVRERVGRHFITIPVEYSDSSTTGDENRLPGGQ